MEVPDLELAESKLEMLQRTITSSSSSAPATSFSEAFAFVRTAPAFEAAAAAPRDAAAPAPLPSIQAAVAPEKPTQNTTTTSVAQSQAGGDVRGQVPRDMARRGAGANLLVSTRQRGNPLLSSIRQVAWEYADIRPDYIMTPTSAAVFISIRYHLLHPQYVFKRMRELRSEFELRVLLIQVRSRSDRPRISNVCPMVA